MNEVGTPVKKTVGSLPPVIPVRTENDTPDKWPKGPGEDRQGCSSPRSFTRVSAAFAGLKKVRNSSLAEPAPDSCNPASGAQVSATTAHPPRKKQPINGRRIVSNAVLSGLSTGLSFGLLASVNNIARIHPNPTVKFAGAPTPMVAGIASAYVSRGIQNVFDIVSSLSSTASIACDAITPAFVMGANYGYALSNLPKFPAASPGGIAATVLVTATGAAVGGGMAELAAQAWSRRLSRSMRDKQSSPSTLQVGIGRAITQLPAAMLNKSIAQTIVKSATSAVPRPLLLAGPAATAIPYMFRQLVTPTTKKSLADTNKLKAALDAAVS